MPTVLVCVCEQDVEGSKEFTSQGIDVNGPIVPLGVTALHFLAVSPSIPEIMGGTAAA